MVPPLAAGAAQCLPVHVLWCGSVLHPVLVRHSLFDTFGSVGSCLGVWQCLASGMPAPWRVAVSCRMKDQCLAVCYCRWRQSLSCHEQCRRTSPRCWHFSCNTLTRNTREHPHPKTPTHESTHQDTSTPRNREQ